MMNRIFNLVYWVIFLTKSVVSSQQPVGTDFVVSTFSLLEQGEYRIITIQYNRSFVASNVTVTSPKGNNSVILSLSNPSCVHQMCYMNTSSITFQTVEVKSTFNVSVNDSICYRGNLGSTECKYCIVYPLGHLATDYDVRQSSGFTHCSFVSTADISVMIQLSDSNLTQHRRIVNGAQAKHSSLKLSRYKAENMHRSGQILEDFHISAASSFAVFCGIRDISASSLPKCMEQVLPNVSQHLYCGKRNGRVSPNGHGNNSNGTNNTKGDDIHHGKMFIMATFSPLRNNEFLQASPLFTRNQTLDAFVAPLSDMGTNLVTGYLGILCNDSCMTPAKPIRESIGLITSPEKITVKGSFCTRQQKVVCKQFSIYPVNKLKQNYGIDWKSNFTSCSVVSTCGATAIDINVPSGYVHNLKISDDTGGYVNLNQMKLGQYKIVFLNNSGNSLPYIQISANHPVAVFCGYRNGLERNATQIYTGYAQSSLQPSTRSTQDISSQLTDAITEHLTSSVRLTAYTVSSSITTNATVAPSSVMTNAIVSPSSTTVNAIVSPSSVTTNAIVAPSSVMRKGIVDSTDVLSSNTLLPPGVSLHLTSSLQLSSVQFGVLTHIHTSTEDIFPSTDTFSQSISSDTNTYFAHSHYGIISTPLFVLSQTTVVSHYVRSKTYSFLQYLSSSQKKISVGITPGFSAIQTSFPTSVSSTIDTETQSSIPNTPKNVSQNIVVPAVPITNQSKCNCPCKKSVRRVNSNKTRDQIQEELKDVLAEIRRNLTVPRNRTSKYKRMKISIYETRPIAMGLGYFGAAVIFTVIGIIVIVDLPLLLRKFGMFKHKVKPHWENPVKTK